MKKVWLFLGVIAAGAASGGLVARKVLQPVQQNGTLIVSSPDKKSSDNRFPQTGDRFAAYRSEAYPDLTYAAERAVEAVVNVEVVQRIEIPERSGDPFFEFFGIPQRGRYEEAPGGERRGGGSGVVVSEDGYIVTNNHVVEGATSLRVKLSDGRRFDAEVVGTDPTTDVALIRIDAEGLPALPFGSSDDLRLGEWVLAIGSPYDLQSTVTAGIVSAKARQLDVIPSELRIESFIQTDAAVNPGNSGGALVNTRGELVGINTVIKTMTGSYIGYSFAVPETIVRKVVDDLRTYGVVQRAMLGLSFRPVDQAFVEQAGEELGIDRIGGVYVVAVDPDGAAAEAGIREGDVILSVDGVSLDDGAALQEQIGRRRPNDRVNLSVKRSDSVKQIEAVLRNRVGKPELLSRDDVDAAEVLGGRFATADERLCRRLKIRGGVQVLRVGANGILARAHVRKGFVITHINDKPVRSVADIRKIGEKVRNIGGIYPDGRVANYYMVE